MMNQSFSLSQASLQFVSGPLAKKTYQLSEQETWIGSDPRSPICIPDQSIQPLHAYLAWNGGHLLVRSYHQSLVLVNQQNISDVSYIQNGDVVHLGQAGIAFQVIFPQQSGIHSLPQQVTTGPASQQYSTIAHLQQSRLNPTSQQSGASTNLAHTETTRYLCAAAHISETFRRYVLMNIVRENHKALGEAYGVDVIPVVKCCLAAERRTLTRDAILASILLLSILGPWILLSWILQSMPWLLLLLSIGSLGIGSLLVPIVIGAMVVWLIIPSIRQITSRLIVCLLLFSPYCLFLPTSLARCHTRKEKDLLWADDGTTDEGTV